MLNVIHPGTGEVIQTYPLHSKEEVETRLKRASETFLTWKLLSYRERGAHLKRVAEVLRAKSEVLAKLMTDEMGKPMKQARAEVEKSAWVLEYYAEQGERILSEEGIQSDATKSYVRFDPMGIIFAIMPWNFPFWQVFRFIAPAAMAGNVGLLKHASNVPGCALAIEEVFRSAEVPDGVFQSLLIRGGEAEALIHDERIAAVTLTGSEAAGRAVASAAGAALKKTVLELGGSDPFIVLRDANISDAIAVATTSRLQNAGQSCIAAKRFIVEEEVADAFISGLKQAFETIKVGDPYDETTEFGPLVSNEARNEIHTQVTKALEAGARCVTGGTSLSRPGFFYAPTILTDITKDMAIYKEEVFGPVALVFRVKNLAEALQIANDTPFGLGAAIWTVDTAKAEEVAKDIVAGTVVINGMVKSDPRLPFGGTKISGYGRELSSYGMKEFVHIKTVWIR